MRSSRTVTTVPACSGRALRIACGTLALALLLLALPAAGARADTGQGVGKTEFFCNRVVYSFEGFPAGENTVHEVVTISKEVVAEETFTFFGSSGTNTIPIPQVPGKEVLDAHATWKINGFNGGFDHHTTVKRCPAGYTVEKLQRLAGEAGYTKSPLTAKSNQTAEYEIVVTNTGLVPLKFSGFDDPNCEAGTIAGGPGEADVGPGEATTFTCTRPLPSIAKYTNVASVTGSPAKGPPVTLTSNEVVITVPFDPEFTIEKLQEVSGSGSGYTTAPVKAGAGQTIDYKFIVTNTGNVPLTFTDFSDSHCDAGTLTGSPGTATLAVGESAEYLCSHVLRTKDLRNGPFTNTASAEASPPEGEGKPASATSNTVIVEPSGGTGTNEFSCKQVVFDYYDFPAAEDTVTETVSKNHEVIVTKQFTFTGPTGTDTIPIELAPGKYILDAHATWHTNGASGGFDHHVNIKCSGE